MRESIIQAISGLFAIGFIILTIVFIYAKMYYHFSYLKITKGYFGKSVGIVDYILNPTEGLFRPMEFIELVFPFIIRDKKMEINNDAKREGEKVLFMLIGFYLSFVLFLVLMSI